VNGTALATVTSTDHIFQWTNVVLATGANTVLATGHLDADVATRRSGTTVPAFGSSCSVAIKVAAAS
jgi:hypothetical protein